MTITQLLYFTAVAEELSITRVAERFHVSQPAVSAAIRDMEKEYQVTLFTRRHHELLLTPVGSTTYRRAKKLLEHYNTFCGTLSAEAEPVRTLSLAIAPNVAAIHLPSLFPCLKKEMPEVSFTIEESRISDMTRDLKSGLLDAALFACTEESKSPDLYYDQIGELSITFCASPALLDLSSNVVTPKDIEGIPLVFQYRSSLLNTAVQNYFADYDMIPEVIFYANQLITILSFIRGGQAAGFLPEELVEEEEEIIPYEMKGFSQNTPLCLVYKTKTKAVEELRKTIIHYMKNRH